MPSADETSYPDLAVIRLFTELVQIPSPPGGERAVADRVLAELRAIGIEGSEDDSAEGLGGTAGNIVARLPATSELGSPLLFCAHLDTVPETDPIEPVIVDGIIRSAGDTILGADNKAAVAVMLQAVRMIVEERRRHAGIELVFTPMEEVGCRGAKALDITALGARYGFVYDHADKIGAYVRSAPAGVRLEIRFVGRAAHAGIAPEDGRSAIAAIAEAIGRIPSGRVEGNATVNIGLISGGSAYNVVPEHCAITVDVRGRSLDNVHALVASILATCREVAAKRDCQMQSETFEKYVDYSLSPDDPIVQLATRALVRTGTEPRPIDGGGGADSSIFNAHGIPCLNLANAMAEIHTSSEQIAVADMTHMVDVTLALVAESLNETD